jgi:hypothetical protein
MRNKRMTRVILSGILLLLMLRLSLTKAQVQGEWSPPYRLSSQEEKASEGYIASDQYGYVHAVWPEHLSESHSIIQYARFDGETWSDPIDIHSGGPIGRTMSLAIDQHNSLHLVWTGGQTGPAYYISAPAHDASSARHWSSPVRLEIPAHRIGLQVDSRDVFHLLYSKFSEPQPGIYYMRSKDQGQTWSDPLWLDPDIPPEYVPNSLEFRLDEVNDDLHAVWQYNILTEEIFTGKDIRYAHSLDGGNNWSESITIDEADEENDELRAGSPILAVHNQNVHIVWAGTSDTRREHRYSTDAGQTWSGPIRIFGELHGQAFESMIVDAAGRVHFFGQIRYPQAIYHAYWNQGHWMVPLPIYRLEGESYYHAHWVRSTVRTGNQLVIIFTDRGDPQQALYAMHRTLNDIPSSTTLPTPTPVPPSTPTPQASPTSMSLTPSPTPAASWSDSSIASASPTTSRPDTPLWLALIPTLVLVGGTVAFQLLRKRY